MRETVQRIPRQNYGEVKPNVISSLIRQIFIFSRVVGRYQMREMLMQL